MFSTARKDVLSALWFTLFFAPVLIICEWWSGQPLDTSFFAGWTATLLSFFAALSVFNISFNEMKRSHPQWHKRQGYAAFGVGALYALGVGLDLIIPVPPPLTSEGGILVTILLHFLLGMVIVYTASFFGYLIYRLGFDRTTTQSNDDPTPPAL